MSWYPRVKDIVTVNRLFTCQWPDKSLYLAPILRCSCIAVIDRQIINGLFKVYVLGVLLGVGSVLYILFLSVCFFFHILCFKGQLLVYIYKANSINMDILYITVWRLCIKDGGNIIACDRQIDWRRTETLLCVVLLSKDDMKRPYDRQSIEDSLEGLINDQDVVRTCTSVH